MDWNENTTTNDKAEITFLNYLEARKQYGEFIFSFTAATLNGSAGVNKDSECITLIDGETDTAVTFWCTPHPDGLQQDPSKTDGAKVGNALKRAFGGSSWNEVFTNASSGGRLSISKNDYPASPTGWAWLFQVSK
tara:strand:- start:440 stop:844 length:405 start_codon:yes stop_codon:yes gene_type:complete